MADTPHTPSTGAATAPFRLPILAALAGSFGLLTVLGGVAFFLALYAGAETSRNLVRERNEGYVGQIEARLRDHLDAVAQQAQHIAALIGARRFDPADSAALYAYLIGSMGANPQTLSISFTVDSFDTWRVARAPDGAIVVDKLNLAGTEQARRGYESLRAASASYWGDLIWSQDLGQALINLRTPVRHEGKFLGGVVATVTTAGLSRYLQDDNPADARASFVLYARDFVLAHARFVGKKMPPPGGSQLLHRVDQIEDPVLAGIWQAKLQHPAWLPREAGHVATIDGKPYVFLLKQVEGYGDQPWLVGRYFPLDDVDEDFSRLRTAAIAAGALLLVGLAIAYGMGRWIGRPVRRLAAAAGTLHQLDFEGPPLTYSRLRELDEAADAFNASRAALKWFSTYVPRRLVTRLMAEGDASMQFKRRDVTILFTDIAGFTPQAEHLSEHELAEFLNHHFAILAKCIEDEQGAIDKFIGDAVMATWGAIKRMPDHADAALRASLAIAAAIKLDNEVRRGRGEAPVRLRLGIHCGPVVIGNIGAPGRINYTVVGDTVNAAQRMEQLGKEYMGEDEDVVLLVSADLVACLADPAAVADRLGPAQAHELRGRSEGLKVHKVRV